MLRRRYTEEQIGLALRQVEAGTPVPELCRKLGIAGGHVLSLGEEVRGARRRRAPTSQATGGREPAAQTDRRRPHARQGDAPGRRSPKMVTPSHRRAAVSYLQAAYGVSERRACRVTGTSRATHRYRSVADPQDELRLRVRELAASRVRYGYRRIHVLLRREGWPVNTCGCTASIATTGWRSARRPRAAGGRRSIEQRALSSRRRARRGRWTSSRTRSRAASASGC